MGYARHIGRVGALAVTLGVGAAIASTPGDRVRRLQQATSSGDVLIDKKSRQSPSTNNDLG